MSRIPVAIDLFSGCGGFSTGLLDAGVAVAAGFDNEQRAIVVYNYNHEYRGARGHAVDLGRATGRDLLNTAGVDSVDLVVGGPPCQAFSIIGKRRGLEDERGKLLSDFARLISEIQPHAFILENVPNLVRFGGGEVLRALLCRLGKNGYRVRYEILSVADYGVPQLRKRLFAVGIADAGEFSFPPRRTHGQQDIQTEIFASELKPHRTASDAIGDLPDVGTPQGMLIPNHEPTEHSSSMLAAFKVLAPGKRDAKSHHDRLHPDRPSYTLRAGSGNFSPLRPIHYSLDRVISVRESARVQGFSDEFIWPDTIPRLQQYRQVGNAVPPIVAQVLARHLANLIGWRLSAEKLRGDANARPSPWSKTPEQRQQERLKRIRGASIGGC